jgi:dTDP-glucose 4,6-dehydratase
MGKKIVVTGGLGFMGSDFVHFISEEHPEFEISIVDNYSYSADPERLADLSSVPPIENADIRDFDVMKRITKGADLVVNFAAETHNDNSLVRPLDFVSTNVNGVAALLEASRENGFRLHHVSTDEVFGDMPVGSDERFVEESPIHPSSPYSASKAAGDSLCLGWFRSFGVDVTISNSANNFGPSQHQEKLIPRSIELIRSGQKPKIYGDGSNVRDWINVRDHSRAVFEIATRAISGSRYVISAHNLVSNIELIQTLNQCLGMPADHFEFVTDRPGHDRQYASDSSKLRSELAWLPVEKDLKTWLQELEL